MMSQKPLTLLLVLSIGFISSCRNENTGQEDLIHSLNIRKTEDLSNFFRYKGEDKPIISGHRGGVVVGYPENSIAAFEHTLRHTPAFFEIDPRLTKDSVIILMHDVTLDRTSTGSGKVSDYTWRELQQLRLKDKAANITDFKIPTLDEVIEWSRGKTILNLDKKDVPLSMIAEKIRKHRAEAFVIVTVHNVEQAKFYYENNKDIMYSAFIKTEGALKEYEEAGIPWENVAIAYVGAEVKPENAKLYGMLHERGVKYMISTASSGDKLKDPEARRQVWQKIIAAGTDVIESDLPIEVARL